MSIAPGVDRRRGRGERLSDRQFAILLVLPGLALFASVVLYPLVSALVTAYFEQSLVIPGRSFAGFDNFQAIAEDIVPTLTRTLVFTLGATLLPFVIGFALALALNTGIRGRSVLRGVFLFPWVVPSVVASFLWLWIFDANFGVLNGILEQTGIISEPISWVGEPNTAMAAVIIAKAWASFPWMMVMLLAGLQTVPAELLESAAVDGANAWQRLWSITIPHLRNVIAVVVLLELIWNFQHFDTLYVLTEGGPAEATTTFSVAVYNTAFKEYDLGKAGALGTVWMLVLTVLVIGFIKLTDREARR